MQNVWGVEIVKYLIEVEKLNPCVLNVDGLNSLQVCIIHNNYSLKIIEYLLHNTDVGKQKIKDHSTLFDWCLSDDSKMMASEFFEFNADELLIAIYKYIMQNTSTFTISETDVNHWIIKCFKKLHKLAGTYILSFHQFSDKKIIDDYIVFICGQMHWDTIINYKNNTHVLEIALKNQNNINRIKKSITCI